MLGFECCLSLLRDFVHSAFAIDQADSGTACALGPSTSAVGEPECDYVELPVRAYDIGALTNRGRDRDIPHCYAPVIEAAVFADSEDALRRYQ